MHFPWTNPSNFASQSLHILFPTLAYLPFTSFLSPNLEVCSYCSRFKSKFTLSYIALDAAPHLCWTSSYCIVFICTWVLCLLYYTVSISKQRSCSVISVPPKPAQYGYLINKWIAMMAQWHIVRKREGSLLCHEFAPLGLFLFCFSQVFTQVQLSFPFTQSIRAQ